MVLVKIKNCFKPLHKENSSQYLRRKSINFFFVYSAILLFIKFCYSAYSNYHNPRMINYMTLLHSLLIMVSLLARAYRFLDQVTFVIELVSPIMTVYSATDFLFAPAFSIFCSISLLVFMQNARVAFFHGVIQVLLMCFYFEDLILNRIAQLTHQELLELVTKSVYSTVRVGTYTCLFVLFYLNFNEKMLTKINLLQKQLSTKNQQLESKTVLLEKSLEENNTFILTFSHEFKNALNGVLGSLRIATENVKDPETLDLLNNANICSHLMRNFAHNLLDSGKIDRGLLETSPENTDFVSFLQNSWNLISGMIRNKRLKGFMKLSRSLPRKILIDSQKLLQVLLNLTSNSVKYTQEGFVDFCVEWEPINSDGSTTDGSSVLRGSISSTVLPGSTCFPLMTDITDGIQEHKDNSDKVIVPSLSPHSKFQAASHFVLDENKHQLTAQELQWFKVPAEKDGYLKISITDTGCGIEQKDTEKLFQKFSQVSRHVEDRSCGTGLGLWITKQMLDLMHGDIKVKSQVGKGTEFEIRIKTVAAAIESDIASGLISSEFKSFADAGALDFSSATKKVMGKVLIADDDSFNTMLLANFLKKLGRETIEVYDGEELISTFRRCHKEIDVVITDNNMPRMKGQEAARLIKEFIKENKLETVPVYMITGDYKEISKQDYKFYGITEIIPKPLDFEKLRKIIS